MHKFNKVISYLVTGFLLASIHGFCKNDIVEQASDLIVGKLDNGLSYYLLPRKTHSDNVGLRLLVNVGAYMEEDQEDGLAHYTEHMAFNGSKNFSEGTLIQYFQRIGMGFGDDVNASTGSKYTMYKLDIPKNSKEEISQAMLVLADQAGRLLFDDNEIIRERGVILSELRTRNSAFFRASIANSKFVFPETIAAKRFIIGTDKTINSFDSKYFRNFYNKWYTADRMAVVVVGDIDADEAKNLVEKHFSFIHRGNASFSMDLKHLCTNDNIDCCVYTDNDLPITAIELSCVSPQKHERNTIDEVMQAITCDVISSALSFRFTDIVNESESPIQEANFLVNLSSNNINYSEIRFSCKNENWQASCQYLEKFFRTVCTFGFSSDEINRAKASVRLTFENGAKNYPTELNSDVADVIADSLMNDRIYVSSDKYLSYFDQLSNDITPEHCLDTWNSLWSNSHKLFVYGNFEQAPVSQEVLETYNNSKAQPVSNLNKTSEKPFNYNAEAKPGNVVSSQKIDEIDTLCLRLANNVRVNIKKTEFSSNEIIICAQIGNGGEFLGENMPAGLDKLISSSLIAGGLENHSHNELSRLFAGKNVQADFDVEEASFAIKAKTNADDLLDQLNVMCAYITSPGYREEGLHSFRKTILAWYEYFKTTPEGVLISQVPSYLACGDNRFGYPEKEVILQRNYDEVRDIITNVLKNDYIELTIIGDLDVETTIAAVRQTFGALSKRALFRQTIPSGRVIKMPKPGDVKIFNVDSNEARAIVSITWPTDDIWDIKKFRRLTLLSDILRNRILFQVRQKLGETYSPAVHASASISFIGRGAITANVIVDPAKALELKDMIISIANSIALDDISSDELARALNPKLTALNASIKTNTYWMQALSYIQSFPMQISWIISMLDDYASATSETLTSLAGKYLSKKNAIAVIAKPRDK